MKEGRRDENLFSKYFFIDSKYPHFHWKQSQNWKRGNLRLVLCEMMWRVIKMDYDILWSKVFEYLESFVFELIVWVWRLRSLWNRNRWWVNKLWGEIVSTENRILQRISRKFGFSFFSYVDKVSKKNFHFEKITNALPLSTTQNKSLLYFAPKNINCGKLFSNLGFILQKWKKKASLFFHFRQINKRIKFSFLFHSICSAIKYVHCVSAWLSLNICHLKNSEREKNPNKHIKCQ